MQPLILNTPGITLVVFVALGIWTPARIREAIGIFSGGRAAAPVRGSCGFTGAVGCTLGIDGTFTTFVTLVSVCDLS